MQRWEGLGVVLGGKPIPLRLGKEGEAGLGPLLCAAAAGVALPASGLMWKGKGAHPLPALRRAAGAELRSLRF